MVLTGTFISAVEK